MRAPLSQGNFGRALTLRHPLVAWVAAAAIVAAIELCVLGVFRPNSADRTNFLHFDFAQAETVQRAVAFLKLRNLAETPAEFLQVGDSSGMHGVVPPVIQSELGGARYLNMSVATTLGYVGYYNVAKYVLEHQKTPGTIKYLVLYTNIFGGPPRRILWDSKELIGHDIRKEFTDPFHRLFQIPSLALRQSVSQTVYYLGQALNQRNRPLVQNEGFLYFDNIYQDSNGWVRETDAEGDIPRDIWRNLRVLMKGEGPGNLRVAVGGVPPIEVETFFDIKRLRNVSYMEHIYGLFYDLAEAHSAKLIVAFNPLPQSSKLLFYKPTANGKGEGLLHYEELMAELNRLKAVYPKAFFQNEIEFWPDDRFSVFSHIETPYAVAGTHALVNVLKQAVPDLKPVDIPGPVRSSNRVLDFRSMIASYGWYREKQPDGKTLPWLGPRDVGALWTSVEPGGAYRLRVKVAKPQPGAVERLAAVVNEELVDGKLVDGETVEWTVPEALVKKWGGWLSISLTTRASFDVATLWDASYPLTAGKSLAIEQFELARK